MSLRRERTLVYAAVTTLVVLRSALFIFTTLAFDADQAIFGLMGKHLVEGRAFPLFCYGQDYMLGVAGYEAAPLFLLFGVSIVTLKLPLLAVNLAIGWIIVTLLERECGLRPRDALLASLFFVMAPVGPTGTLFEVGSNVEPLLYVLLLWLTRRRPVWFGIIAGIGFLHREFTIYGVAAVLAIELAQGAWRRREDLKRLGSAIRVAAETWVVIYFLRFVASPSGPGTVIAPAAASHSNVLEALGRLCLDGTSIPRGIAAFVSDHWGQIFGTKVVSAQSFGLESQVQLGLTGSGFVLGVAALLMLVRVGTLIRFEAGWWRRYAFIVFLGMVGCLSASTYIVARCGVMSAIRYDMLSIFVAVALTAWFLALEPRIWIRRAGIAVVLAWTALSAVGHARLWVEYVPHAPVPDKTLIVRNLDARGIKYAMSDYWIAYHIDFLTNERIIVGSEDLVRIQEYQDIVAAHRQEAIRISRQPCAEGGPPVIPGVWFCRIE